MLDAPTIGAGAAVVAAIGALGNLGYNFFISRRTLAQREYELVQKAHEEERKEIYKKLNSFYGPMRYLLSTNTMLYKQFRIGKPENFATLTTLLSGSPFEGNDRALLNQILEINAKVEELIIAQSGLVDSIPLKDMLARASLHFRLIKMANDGTITGEIERFKDHTYPLELSPMIDAETERLQSRLRVLNSGPIEKVRQDSIGSDVIQTKQIQSAQETKNYE